MEDRYMTTTICRGCGKPVVFAVDEFGKTQILDMRAPVFSVKEAIDGNGNQVLVCNRIEKGTCGVTHFATCSHANEFSRNRKAKP